MNIHNFLLKRIHQAFISINIESFFNTINIQPSKHEKFGDYQINGLITIAKHLNIPVKLLSENLIEVIDLRGIAKLIKFEKPGFINIFLQLNWIENNINQLTSLTNLGVNHIKPKKIIIDYSGPNIAKEMHVGHLRSTVIGDSIARILSFLGHHVIRANHIGDWGTQFGMLIAYIQKNKLYNFIMDNKKYQFSELEQYYQNARKEYDTDPNFAKLSRQYVVKLQNGDYQCQQLWKYLVDISILNNQKLYKKLNITLKKDDIMGESFYQNMLPKIVSDLKKKKLAKTSNGATVVFLNNFYRNKKKSSFGVIIQKKDGGYLYSTTDIACIKYRCEILNADRIIYYTDSRQKQHLIQAWTIASKAGYIKKKISLEHHICGMLLEKNGTPFKTRSGNTLKLKQLLNESLKRTRYLIKNKNPHLKYQQINRLTHIIGIGSIKYSELSKNRTTNYIFDWNHILNFENNTALYIQYTYTRIFSILNKPVKELNFKKNNYFIKLITKEEISLAICLLQFHEIIITVANKGTPHTLCNYLYKLSTLSSLFYENCPILTTHNIHIKYSRLKLISLTARFIKKGLNLLGISVSKYM